MFVSMTIHRPHPGKEALVLEAMHHYAEASKNQLGLQQVQVLRDTASGELVGLTLWDNEAAMVAARDAAREASKDDDFESWQEPIKAVMFEEV